MGTERSGRCLCGAVTFTVTPQVNVDGSHTDGLEVDACHCGMCRRAVGGPLFGVVLQGAPKVDDASELGVYASSEWAERLFCRRCGSNLFFRMKNGALHTVNAGALDDLSDARLTVEIFVDDKPDFYDFAQPTRKMTGAQVMAAFAAGQGANGDG